MSSFIGQRGKQKKLNSISVLTLKRNGTITGKRKLFLCLLRGCRLSKNTLNNVGPFGCAVHRTSFLQKFPQDCVSASELPRNEKSSSFTSPTGELKLTVLEITPSIMPQRVAIALPGW